MWMLYAILYNMYHDLMVRCDINVIFWFHYDFCHTTLTVSGNKMFEFEIMQ